MGTLASFPATANTYNARTLALIKRTVAADCNEDEFNLFIWTARHLRLDPLRRQVFAMVFSKGDAAKRRMSIITSIDGFRTIAERTGNYRPDEEEPTYEVDDKLKGPLNPAGLVKATVRVWKFAHGGWHKVTASAHWDEYAPIRQEAEAYEWVETGETWPDSGKPKKKKQALGEVRAVLDGSGNWPKMPRLMLAKCAEALALRKAWPDDFANVYAAEEIDRTHAAELPSEAAASGAADERLEKIGSKDAILIQWQDHAPVVPVPVGQLADRVMAFIAENPEQPGAIAIWRDRNRHALREFWAKSPGDALAVKQALEKATVQELAE